MLVVNAARKEADLAHLRPSSAARSRSSRCSSARCWPCRGRRPPRCWRGFVAGGRADAVHERGRGRRSPARPASSPAPAIPARTGSRFRCAAEDAVGVRRARCSREPEVAPIGLGARDTLRLEAGLCLYGHDIDETTTPIEAGLAWTIGKRRRAEGGFPGAAAILRAAGRRRRRASGSASARTAAPRRARAPRSPMPAGNPIGRVTSGGFGPIGRGADRDGLCRRRARRRGRGAGACRARRAAAGAGRATAVRPDPLLPRLTAASGGNHRMSATPLHQGP